MKPLLFTTFILGALFSLVTATGIGKSGFLTSQLGGIPPKPVPQKPTKIYSMPTVLDASQSRNLMGMNIDFTGDYSGTRMFADAIKQSRPWQTIGSEQPANLDQNGWPLEDAHLAIWHGISRMNGTYRLSFNGQADMGIDCCAGSIQNKIYRANTNTTTADLIYPAKDGVGLFLKFQKTQRTPASSSGSGITNVKLMRPTTEGGTQTYDPSILFTNPFKASLKRFKVLRFMDFLASNSNGQEHWSDRLTPPWFSMAQSAPGYGWQGRGGAYEYALSLCNELSADCWLNVPVKADDNYVRQLAILIKSKLNSKQNVYIEYSNELWNNEPAFRQSVMNHDLAKAEVAIGNSPLNFDGESNEVYWSWRRTAKRSAEISLIFRQVFGDAAMMKRVRPLLMTQLGYTDGPLLQAVHLMQDYYNNPARVDHPKPLRYYFYGLGGSGYYNPKNATSPDAVFADFTNRTEWVKTLQTDTDYAVAFGVKRIAYEGGPSLERGNITDANRPSYRETPRMTEAMVEAHDLWSANGGDLLTYFTITGESTWGFVPDIWDAANPKKNFKLQAIDVLNTRTRAKATYGVPLPATLEARKFNIPPSWLDDRHPERLKPGQWFSYTTQVRSAATFNLKLKAGSANADSTVELWIDGTVLETIEIPKTGFFSNTMDTQTLAIKMSEGIHSIMIRGKHGTVNLNQIIISPS
jgi:hypothetical protein